MIGFWAVTISAVSDTVHLASSRRVEVRIFLSWKAWTARHIVPTSMSISQTSTRIRVDIIRFRPTDRVGMRTFRATSANHDVKMVAVFLAVCILSESEHIDL